MMDNSTLESLWKEIRYAPPGQYVYRRIDAACQPDLNVGVNSDNNRCLFLDLPKGHSNDFQSIARQNLALYYYRNESCIVLELLDASFNDLFTDLTLSIYNQIKYERDASLYASTFVKFFHRWSEFFTAKSSERLTSETIMGIFGELIVLRSLVQASTTTDINDVLRSWRGPYDNTHDFIQDQKNIEVKTKSSKKITIRISSEFQLEEELGKRLELSVVSVSPDLTDGITVADLINSVRIEVMDRCGDITILIETLGQTGLNFRNMIEYNNFRFLPLGQDIYDPQMTDFPRLIRSKLPSAICDVKYNLNLSVLDQFLLRTESIKWK